MMNEVSQPNLSDGEQLAGTLKDRGYSDQEVDQWKGQMTDTLRQRKFSDQEIDHFWGTKPPDMSQVQNLAQTNFQALNTESQTDQPSESTPKPKREPIDVSPKPIEAKDIWDAMAAGYGNSILQLAKTGQESPIALGDNAGVGQHLANMAAGMLSDSPFFVVGGEMGGPAGAFGLPAALRATYIDSIRNGDFHDGPGDFAKRVTNIAWEGAKGYLTGTAMEIAGLSTKLVNMAAADGTMTKALTGTVGQYASELAAQTTVSNGLEGKLPSYQDFLYGSVMVGGLHALGMAGQRMGPVGEKLMNIFANTNATPEQVDEIVNKNPGLKGPILSDNPKIPEEAKFDPDLGPQPPETTPEKTNVPIEPEPGTPEEKMAQVEKEIDSRIGEEPEPTKKSFLRDLKNDAFDRYVDMFDKTAGIKDFLSKIKGIKLADSAYGVARFFGDINSKIEHFFQVGTIDPETNKVNGESLKNVFDDIRNFDPVNGIAKVRRYLMSQHSLELSRRGIEQPGSRENDQFYVDSNQHLDDYAKRIVGFQNRVLNYARGKGLISGESYQNMVDKNQYYLPFQKIMEAADAMGGARLGSLKKIGSSMLQIQDPLTTLRRNSEMLIKAADENFIKQKMFENMMMHDKPEEIMENLKPTKQIMSDGVIEQLQKQGVDFEGINPEFLKVFTRADVPKGDDIFYFRDEGKLQAVRTVDPKIAEVMNSFSDNYQGMDAFVRAFSTAAKATRFGTIQNPLTGFFLRHAIRNQIQGPIFSQTNMKPGEALQWLFRGDTNDWMNRMVRAGGAVSAIDKMPDAFFTDQMQGMEKSVPIKKWVWNKVDNALDFSHAFILGNDIYIRLTEFKRAIEQGKSDPEAALMARDVLADFQKNGLQMSALQSMKAFFKAHYQGQFQMGGAIGDAFSSNPDERSRGLGVLARNIGYVTVPSVLLAAAQYNDDRLNSEQGWLRDGYWRFHMPSWNEVSLPVYKSHKSAYPNEVKEIDGKYYANDGFVFRVPKPFTNGMLFGSAVEEGIRAWNKSDPSEFSKFLGRVGENVVANPLMTFAQPMVEQAVNKNLYSSQQLVRTEMERNRLPWLRYEPYTSKFSIWLGDKLHYVPAIGNLGPKDAPLMAPPVLDNYIKSWTGGSGKYILSTMDQIFGKYGVPDPDWRWDEAWGVREFFARSTLRPDDVNEFQERQDFASQVQGSIKFLAQQGDQQGAAKIASDLAVKNPKLNSLQEGISNMQRSIHYVLSAKSPDLDRENGMTGVQKRQAIESLTYQIIAAAREGNKIMDDIQKNVKDLKKGQ